MKTKSMMLVIGLLFFSMTSLFAMVAKTEKIKVSGNCGQCKTRIEKAARSVDGVSKATWNEKDGILTITFDGAKTTTMKIEDAIAKVGHDTEHMKATDKAYNALPACCQYRR
jgi:mercuric ion binding protein